GLPAPAPGSLRAAVHGDRRLQRGPGAAVAMAGATAGDGSGVLDRDHQLQGNARVRRARPGLQRVVRLAAQWRCGTGDEPDAWAGRRGAEEVRVPGGGPDGDQV